MPWGGRRSGACQSTARRTSGGCTSLQQGGHQVRVLIYSKEDIRWVYQSTARRTSGWRTSLCKEAIRWVYKYAARRTSGGCTTSLQQGGHQVGVLVYSEENIRWVYQSTVQRGRHQVGVLVYSEEDVRWMYCLQREGRQVGVLQVCSKERWVYQSTARRLSGACTSLQ